MKFVGVFGVLFTLCLVSHLGETLYTVSYECPPGLYWDVTYNYCAYPVDANSQAYDIECPAAGITNVPHPIFCNQFYVCVIGEPLGSVCPGDLLFDVTIMECNSPEVAVCYEGTVTQSPSQTI